MKRFIQILIFFLLITQLCIAQWYQQTSGTTKSLNSIFFIDSLSGWAVGEANQILKTTNGGSDWFAQVGDAADIREVFFVNENIGWIVGGQSV